MRTAVKRGMTRLLIVLAVLWAGSKTTWANRPEAGVSDSPSTFQLVAARRGLWRSARGSDRKSGNESFRPLAAPRPVALDEAIRLAQRVGQSESGSTAAGSTTSDNRPVAAEPSAQQVKLRNSIRACLRYYYRRPEQTAEHSPWGIMHALIAYGVDTEILTGNRRVNAIGWMCWNQPCRGMKLFDLDADGEIEARLGPGYQGHEAQFLSMLALSRVKLDYPMKIGQRELTVADLLDYEKSTCYSNPELTFKLIGIAHYEHPDATWTGKADDAWSIERLIEEELAQPVNGACCGGTHRLIGLSVAVRRRAKLGLPMTGQWARAAKFIDDYHKFTMKLQNRDGSFSTAWFKGREDNGKLDRKIQTTGHILEWLVYSLPQHDLDDPRIVRAVSFITASLSRNTGHEWEIGPKGHALRSIALYNERMFGDKPGQREAFLNYKLRR